MAVDQGGGDLPVKPCALGAGAVVRDSRVIAPRCNRQRCRRNKSQEYLHWLCRRDQHTTALTKAVTAEVRMWEGYTTARRTRVRDMRHARLEAGRVRKFKDPLLGGYLEHIGFSEALAARKFPPRLGGEEGFKLACASRLPPTLTRPDKIRKYALGYLVNPPSVWPGFSLKPRAEDGGNEMVTREYA